MNGLSVKHHQEELDVLLMMQRYEHMLLRFCTRMLQDRDLAQDAVQETFLKAHLKRGTFRGEHENSERAWLMQIAANTCIDQKRSKWVRFVNGRISLESTGIPAFYDEEKMMLRWAIDALPDLYRKIVVMYYYQDMTIHEIAFSAGQSPSVVYRRLKKAKALLGELLQ